MSLRACHFTAAATARMRELSLDLIGMVRPGAQRRRRRDMFNPPGGDLLGLRGRRPGHLEPRAAPRKILNLPGAMRAPYDGVGDGKTEPASLTC
jgi:hypothetical protein